jgi:CopG family transcriptional regulator/antitoxin EndoAI
MMEGGELNVRKRINISLPEETVRLIDRVANKGDRSALIDEAVRNYVSRASRRAVRRRLAEGAERRADRDLEIAEDWLALDNEAWQPNARRRS